MCAMLSCEDAESVIENARRLGLSSDDSDAIGAILYRLRHSNCDLTDFGTIETALIELGLSRDHAYSLAIKVLDSNLLRRPWTPVKPYSAAGARLSSAGRTLRGVLFDEDMRTLIRFPPDMEDEAYFVPDSVETIADRAFENSNIKRVVLPKRLRKIGSCAF